MDQEMIEERPTVNFTSQPLSSVLFLNAEK